MAAPQFVLTVTLTVGLLALPLLAEAQAPVNAPRIGFLGLTTGPSSAGLEAFRAGLHDFGYISGKNIVIESRWAENRYDRLPALAAELVRLKVDVLVTYSTPGILAAKRATTTIPIVMVTSGDAVATGLVASLARPGGNVTGATLMSPELYAKQLELLKAVLPDLRRAARQVNPDNPAYATIFKEAEQAAAMKIELSHLEARTPGDFGAAFAAVATRGVEAVVISADPMFLANVKAIADIATKRRIASIGRRQFAEAGGLMGFDTSDSEQFRRASYFVDRILKGAKPAELPVEQPTKFELVINLRTAKALGLTIPPAVLARADEVIR